MPRIVVAIEIARPPEAVFDYDAVPNALWRLLDQLFVRRHMERASVRALNSLKRVLEAR
jgi:hypothetical protein